MNDADFMQLALAQAQQAQAEGEVPVGAVVVHAGQVVAVGRNACVGQNDPTAHAEMVALRAAAQVLGNYRLQACTLYVTLEPCAMCCGAMLHARLARVVFGAWDAKTGAVGSVLNLCGYAQLNHQTQTTGGVQAVACAALLQGFFQQRRSAQREQQRSQHPLRQDALRTPQSAFAGLPCEGQVSEEGEEGEQVAQAVAGGVAARAHSHFVSHLPALAGLRMHYVDAIDPNAARQRGPDWAGSTYVCLPGPGQWSAACRPMLPVLLAAGHRVLVPDLVGFGKSDKPKKEAWHTWGQHRQVLLEWVEQLDLRRVVLVLQSPHDTLGLSLPLAALQRYQGLLLRNTTGWPMAGLNNNQAANAVQPGAFAPHHGAQGPAASELLGAVETAPFPNAGYQAGLRALDRMYNPTLHAASRAVWAQTQVFWQNHWTGKTLTTPPDTPDEAVATQALGFFV